LLRATDAEASGWNAVEAVGVFEGVDDVFGLQLVDGRAALAFNVDADGPDPRLIRRALYFAVED